MEGADALGLTAEISTADSRVPGSSSSSPLQLERAADRSARHVSLSGEASDARHSSTIRANPR